MKRIALLLAVAMLLTCFCALSVAGGYYVSAGEGTLPAEAEGEGLLVGWEADGALYAPGADYSLSEAATFEPVFLDIETLSGAAVRTVDPAGLRFTTTVSEPDYQALKGAAKALELGTVIAPTDYISGDFTMEALDKAGKEYLDIPCKLFWDVNESTRTYTGVISNILEKNYNRAFSAVAYAKVTYTDGSTVTHYGNYATADNSRTVYSVACNAMADANASYTDAAKAVLQNYFDKVGIDVSVTVPVAGAKPENAVANTDGAFYTVKTEWMCQFIDPMPETFLDKTGNQITVTVTAASGLTITENTVASYNGEPLRSGADTIENGVLTIKRRYCLGGYTWAY